MNKHLPLTIIASFTVVIVEVDRSIVWLFQNMYITKIGRETRLMQFKDDLEQVVVDWEGLEQVDQVLDV